MLLDVVMTECAALCQGLCAVLVERVRQKLRAVAGEVVSDAVAAYLARDASSEFDQKDSRTVFCGGQRVWRTKE